MSISSSSSSYPIASILTSKGDIAVHNGTTLIRQAVGSNGYTLVSDSSAVGGVAWTTAPAGGTAYQVPIAYTTITASTGTATISSIPNSYKAIGFIALAKDTSAGQRDLFIRFNSSTTSYRYVYRQFSPTAASVSAGSQARILLEFAAGNGSGHQGYASAVIQQYANTSNYKSAIAYFGGGEGTTRGVSAAAWFDWYDTVAISSISFWVTGAIASGSAFYVYGLK